VAEETSLASVTGAELLQAFKIGQTSHAWPDISSGQVSARHQTSARPRKHRNRNRPDDLGGGAPTSIVDTQITNYVDRHGHTATLDLSPTDYLNTRQVFDWIVQPPGQAFETSNEATSTYIQHRAKKSVPHAPRQGSSHHSKGVHSARAARRSRPASIVSSEGTYVTASLSPELAGPTLACRDSETTGCQISIQACSSLASDSVPDQGTVISLSDHPKARGLPGSYPSSPSSADSGASTLSGNKADPHLIANEQQTNVSVRGKSQSILPLFHKGATTRSKQSALRSWWRS
jgi:hypothetical protein